MQASLCDADIWRVSAVQPYAWFYIMAIVPPSIHSDVCVCVCVRVCVRAYACVYMYI
jgi:hypothetical protein